LDQFGVLNDQAEDFLVFDPGVSVCEPFGDAIVFV
jgi:hypothetical protein